ncbi:hypothetical protein [Persicobacter diffluens]|uniref:Uncharacterized protein n=1 Tax=Persicobacter diffluens TaxID=981 RepID=A0AAN5AL79_9BACT|nr:hypothetical protein PEDI_17330 [Persicobacter diffluens]
MMNYSYFDYYKANIREKEIFRGYSNSDGEKLDELSLRRLQAGFKLVPGGTGCGKTSSIHDVMMDRTIEQPKFIYLANRVQLVNEVMQGPKEYDADYAPLIAPANNDQKYQGKGPYYIKLFADSSMFDAITEDELNDMLENPLVLSILKSKKGKRLNAQHLKLKKLHESRREFHDRGAISQDTEDYQREAMQFFKTIMTLSNRLQRATKKKKEGANENFRHIHSYLKDLYVIRKMFPYIDFMDEKIKRKKILVMTIQKAFYGCFDGERKVSVATWKDERRFTSNQIVKGERRPKSIGITGINRSAVIFMDEFDYLESTLVGLLCSDLKVKDCKDFVAMFHRAMRNDKLPSDLYFGKFPELRKDIDRVVERIETSLKKIDINFPLINHFIMEDEELEDPTIFQTRSSIPSVRIKMEESKTWEGSFNILKQESDEVDSNLLIFLDLIKSSVSNILRLFKTIHLASPDLYFEILDHCYRINPQFQQVVRQSNQIPAKTKQRSTQRSTYMAEGFSNFEITRLNHESSPHGIDIDLLAVYTTAEWFLYTLCRNNMVFGMSATAILERPLGNFDLSWLKEELHDSKLSEQDRNLWENGGYYWAYYDISREEQANIHSISLEKAQIRANKVKVVDNTVDQNHVLIKMLNKAFINRGVESLNNPFRADRMLNFFAIMNNSVDLEHHLVFVESMKQIEHVLDGIRKNRNLFSKIITVGEVMNKYFSCYTVNSQGKQFNVLLVDAAFNRKLENNAEMRREYEQLFVGDSADSSAVPLIFVTTTSTASNGVNLQFHETFEDFNLRRPYNKDFTHIHIIDAKHFFFSGIDPEADYQQIQSAKAMNIYNVSKLYYVAKAISYPQLERIVSKPASLGHFNIQYKNTDHAKIEQLTVIMQQLGRIERCWATSLDQYIHLSDSVKKLMKEIMEDEYTYHKVMGNVDLYSENIRSFLQQIDTKLWQENYLDEMMRVSIREQNGMSKKFIDLMVDDNSNVRKGNIRGEQADQKIRDWEVFADAVMKHDFMNRMLKDSPHVFKSNEMALGYIKRDDNLNIYPVSSTHPDSWEWNLNSVYKMVNENMVISHHFDLKKYEKGFTNIGTYFVPYIWQSIIKGRVGEEIVKALLRTPWLPERAASCGNGQETLTKVKFDKRQANPLFELTDIKITGIPCFIDVKHYSEYSINELFALKEGTKMNIEHIEKKIGTTMGALRKNAGPKAKLIFINAAYATDYIPRYLTHGYDDTGKVELHAVQSFQEAVIICIPSVLENVYDKESKQRPYLTKGFIRLVRELNNAQAFL